MSIRGFNVGTGVEQYDYNYLDNLPDTEEYTAAEKAKLGALPTKSDLDAELAAKADASELDGLDSEIALAEDARKYENIIDNQHETIVNLGGLNGQYTGYVSSADIKRENNLFFINGTIASNNTRFAITGTELGYSSSSPTASRCPNWYVNNLTDFVVGHSYQIHIKLLSGTVNWSASDGLAFLTFRTTDQSLNESHGDGYIWTCTVVPNMVCVVFKAGTFSNCVYSIEFEDITEKLKNAAQFHELEKNPYQCSFDNYREVLSTTHAHCTTDAQLVDLANVYDHVAISNYHPSVPYYPAEEFFPEPLKYLEYSNSEISGTRYKQITGVAIPAGDYTITVENVTSADVDSTTCRVLFYDVNGGAAGDVQIGRGNNVSASVTLSATVTYFYVYASNTTQHAAGDAFTFTNMSMLKDVTGVYDNFRVSPNAEHAGFSDQSASVHINGVGSFHSKDTENSGKTLSDVAEAITNSLQFPLTGGVTINHPTYSGLTATDVLWFIYNVPGVFAMEIYNAGCEATNSTGYALTQWDEVLAKGLQIYGVAVPDHEVQYHPTENRAGFGYCHVMVRAKTEQQILQAYSCGRIYSSIYNDTLKFTELYYKASTGFSVETSASCTIKFVTANGVQSTVTGTEATYVPVDGDVYVRVEATDGTNTLYSNAVIL